MFSLRFWVLAVNGFLLFGWPVTVSSAAEVVLNNSFTFYSDNTEFFAPFRLRETTLGEQFQSALSLQTGGHTTLRAGLWADHRDGLNSTTDVQPIFSFIYQDGALRNVMGAITPSKRHGLIEPMESTILELTRPVEYGTQLMLENSPVNLDLFINWQYLLTASSREIFDYGGSVHCPLDTGIQLEAQGHCYHVGGVSYGGIVRNNFVGGLGFSLESRLPLAGNSSLEAYGLFSNDTARPSYPGPVSGAGLYVKGVVSPFEKWEFFGLAWIGKDFESEEGDGNYNSFGYDGIYYKSDRHYEEAGIRYSAELDERVTFDFELRSHWIEEAWAHSFRITARAPFDLEIGVTNQKSQHEATKTRRTDDDEESK